MFSDEGNGDLFAARNGSWKPLEKKKTWLVYWMRDQKKT